MVWKPRVTVASVIEHENRFLMVEEIIDGKPTINQPAGHLEHGETLLDAVRRETLEETAYRFEPAALLGIFHMQYGDDPDRVFLRFTFTGQLLETEPVAGYQIDADITAVHWLTLAEINARQPQVWRSELVGKSLDAYAAGVRHSLDSLHYFLAGEG